MSYNSGKLIVTAVLTLVFVAAIIVDSNNTDWAVPLLGLLVGYVIGNAAVTSQEGNVSPIVSKAPPGE